MIATQSLGTCPFYYNSKGNKLISASSIGEILEKGVPMELNYEAIPAFLMYQYGIGGVTLFKDIRMSQSNQIEVTQNPKTVESSVSLKLRDLIGASITNKTEEAQQIVLLLSGGIDSSAISAIATRVCGHKVRAAFTATFKDHSELDEAINVAKFLRVRLHDIPITADMVARNIESITELYEEPLGDAALINNYFLCKTASSYADTVLCGDGGDEIFGGYPWHHYAKYIPWMSRTPLWLRKLVQRKVVGDPTRNRNGPERILLFPAQLSTDEMILYPTTAMSHQNLRWLLKSGICSHSFVPNYHKDIYSRVLAMDCLNLLPGKFMMKTKKFSPPAIYSPLVDREIISFAFGLPSKLRRDKYILRRAVEDMLPYTTVWKRKAGFGTPIAGWLNSDELKPMVLDKLSNGKLLNEICRKQSLADIIDALKSGNIKGDGIAALDISNIVWGLFTLQVWHDVLGRKSTWMS